MIQRKQNFWDKKIPSYISVLFLVLSVGAIIWLSGNSILFGTKAAAGNTPKNVQITNISDASFTVTYTTDESVIGVVGYAKDATEKLENLGLDDRDQEKGVPMPHRVHHITVQKLEPQTKYYFSIASADEAFMNDTAPYEVTTAPKAEGSPIAQSPAAGKVTLDDGTIPTEGIVYLSSENSQLLSVLLKPDGSYLLPLVGMRKDDLSGYFQITPTTSLQMRVVNATLQSSISLLASQTDPVPQIVLSKDYDFGLSNDPLFPATDASSSASASPSASPPPLPKATEPPLTGTLPAITTPKNDQKFNDLQPTFKGKAVPNSTVEITINSQTEITATVEADENGNWKFRPEAPLEPGVHTLTIKAPDLSGIMQTISQPFTVYAQGSQFIEPSREVEIPPTATTAPRPTTVTPTTAQPSPTVAPTNTPAPTATPTVSPTVSPTVDSTLLTTSPAVTSAPTPPPTGNSALIFGFAAVVISIVVGGILLFAL